MSKPACMIVAAFILALPLQAQRAKAPNGYYPSDFNGVMFTGKLESVDADTQELTLVYAKGSKTERFVGHLEAPCQLKGKDGTQHTATASQFPKGSVLTAFFNTTTKKVGVEKVTENSIFGIIYVELNGKQIPEDKRLSISCSAGGTRYFRAF